MGFPAPKGKYSETYLILGGIYRTTRILGGGGVIEILLKSYKMRIHLIDTGLLQIKAVLGTVSN